MLIGCPTETKVAEKRVGLTPGSVSQLVAAGHSVLVQSGAGEGIGAGDDVYREVGAEMADDAEAVFGRAELVVKVKEPLAAERRMLREGQTLFTYLHLAPDPEQTADLRESGVTAIAYETVTDDHGALPLLGPMSRVAGRLSIQVGATALEATHGGAGLLLGGVAGVPPAKVVVIGGGVVGANAVEMAAGLGAEVTVLDRNPAVLEGLAIRFGTALRTVFSTPRSLEQRVLDADLVVGAVLVKGSRAPRLVDAEMVHGMRDGSVLVDVAIDQGGCFETSRPTTHADPTYIHDGVVHYCVANMPGAVPRTSAHALNNSTLPYVLELAGGVEQALRGDEHLRSGLNIHRGAVTEQGVAEALGLDYLDPLAALDL